MWSLVSGHSLGRHLDSNLMSSISLQTQITAPIPGWWLGLEKKQDYWRHLHWVQIGPACHTWTPADTLWTSFDWSLPTRVPLNSCSSLPHAFKVHLHNCKLSRVSCDSTPPLTHSAAHLLLKSHPCLPSLSHPPLSPYAVFFLALDWSHPLLSHSCVFVSIGFPQMINHRNLSSSILSNPKGGKSNWSISCNGLGIGGCFQSRHFFFKVWGEI